MKKQNNEDKKKILIVTAFPTHGAGSGALITTQAKSYVENGDEVVIIKWWDCTIYRKNIFSRCYKRENNGNIWRSRSGTWKK